MKNKALLTVFFIVFLDLFGFGIILPLLPFIAEEFHANPFQIGLLTSTYSFFQLIAAPILGRLSDRYGRKKLLVVSQIGSAAGYILLGLAHSLPLLFLSRLIDGVTGGNISVAQAYVADVTDKKDRAKGMGMLGAAFGLGFIFGPAFGGFLSQWSFAAPAYAAAAMAGLTALATSYFLKESIDTKKAITSPHTRFNLDEIKKVLSLRPVGLLIIIFLLFNTGFSVIQGNFALWTERTFSYTATENGYLLAFIGVVSASTQLLALPRLLKRFSEIKLLKMGTLAITIGMFSFLLVTKPFMLFFSILFIPFGFGLINPSIQALASENVPPEDYGGVLGTLQSAGSLGRVFGPAGGGELFHVFGKNSPFAASGTMLLFVYLILLQYFPEKMTLMQKIKLRLKSLNH